MSLKDMFNYVKEHLLKQGEHSIIENNTGCAYRGANGLQCAVGCLIPDSLYELDMEGESSSSLLNNYPQVDGYLCDKYGIQPDGYDKMRTLLRSLQTIHDNRDVSIWSEQLDKLEKTLFN